MQREPVRLVVSVPPRHGKTETLLHAMAWELARDPTLPIAYASYGADFARTRSRRARTFAEAAGVQIDQSAHAASDWYTTAGGGVKSDGIAGQWTGRGFKRIYIDDPHKRREEAESAAIRERVWNGWNDDLATRADTADTSVIVCMARWHPDDLAGRLIAEGWECINLPALGDDDAALWPERWPAEELHRIKAARGEYTWSSLYQGAPRPRGGALFGDTHTYTPEDLRGAKGLVYGVGVDLAYSSKTHADYSVAVVLAREDVPANGVEGHRRFYVVDVIRKQCPAPEFAATLRSVYGRHPTAARRAYLAGTEKGTDDFLTSQGVRIGAMPPTGDKFIRAQPVAAAWNRGHVLVPESAPWADAFVSELAGFTGVNDDHDDQVDAFAAAFDVLATPVADARITTGGRRESADLRQPSGLREKGWGY